MMANWKTTLSGVLLLIAGAVAVADHDSLEWLGTYEKPVQSAAKFVVLLAVSGGLLAAKDGKPAGATCPPKVETK